MAKQKEALIIASKVKALIKKGGCNTAGDALEGLNEWSGTLFFYRRGKRTGRVRYYAVAVLIYAASWAALAISLAFVSEWIIKIFFKH